MSFVYKNNFEKIFSLKNYEIYKVLTLFGIKIKFKIMSRVVKQQTEKLNRKINDFEVKQNQINFKQNYINFESFLKETRGCTEQSYTDFIKKFFVVKSVTCAAISESWFNHLSNMKYLFENQNIKLMNKKEDCISDYYIFWGTRLLDVQMFVMENAFRYGKPALVAELGFINCIKNMADEIYPKEFFQYISFMFDDLAPYYDARQLNRMEQMLNDKNFVITDEQRQRARSCIDIIVDTHLTKYNHQPIYEPQIGVNGRKKVLVVDQSYGDMSISKGLANDDTFKNMLSAAISENPDADIIVKTHPDTIEGAGGYYKGLKAEGNVYTMTDPINPISLIKSCDKVYVCTTQLGFEALMCGKEVHVFGMPFYAGWGLTKDRQVCERRTNKRTLEEVFYIAYILYTHYVNPDTESPCEIEEAMNYLLTKRNEFTEYGKCKTN